MKLIHNGYFICLTMTIVALTAFSGNTWGEEGNNQFWSVRSNRVYIRKGPGKQYPVSYLAGNGFPVLKMSRSGNWFRVKDFQGETGWIHKNFIRRVRYVIVSVGGKTHTIHVRDRPSTQSRILAKATYSAVFRYIKKEKGWVNVRHDSGITGWIRADLVWGD